MIRVWYNGKEYYSIADKQWKNKLFIERFFRKYEQLRLWDLIHLIGCLDKFVSEVHGYSTFMTTKL